MRFWLLLGIISIFIALPAQGQVLILDNTDDEFTIESGEWTSFPPLNNCVPCYGQNIHFAYAGTGQAKVRWTPRIPKQGKYDIHVWWFSDVNISKTVPFTVSHAEGTNTFIVDQSENGSQWNFLGTFPFIAGPSGYVELSNATLRGTVVADAVKFEFKEIYTGDFCPDIDSDGYLNELCGGLDCNDDDPAINPDAEEICGNLVDEDCNPANNECNICGNGVADPGENCSNCPEDLDCALAEIIPVLESGVKEGKLFTIVVYSNTGQPLEGVLAQYGTQSVISKDDGKITLRAFGNIAPVVILSKEGYLNASVTLKFPEDSDTSSEDPFILLQQAFSGIISGDDISFEFGDYLILFLVVFALIVGAVAVLIIIAKKSPHVKKQQTPKRTGIPPIVSPASPTSSPVSSALKPTIPLSKAPTSAPAVAKKPLVTAPSRVPISQRIKPVKAKFSKVFGNLKEKIPKRKPKPAKPAIKPKPAGESLTDLMRKKKEIEAPKPEKPVIFPPAEKPLKTIKEPPITPVKQPEKPTVKETPSKESALDQMIKDLEKRVPASEREQKIPAEKPVIPTKTVPEKPSPASKPLPPIKPAEGGLPPKPEKPPEPDRPLTEEEKKKKRIEELKKRMKESLGEIRLDD